MPLFVSKRTLIASKPRVLRIRSFAIIFLTSLCGFAIAWFLSRYLIFDRKKKWKDVQPSQLKYLSRVTRHHQYVDHLYTTPFASAYSCMFRSLSCTPCQGCGSHQFSERHLKPQRLTFLYPPQLHTRLPSFSLNSYSFSFTLSSGGCGAGGLAEPKSWVDQIPGRGL